LETQSTVVSHRRGKKDQSLRMLSKVEFAGPNPKEEETIQRKGSLSVHQSF
jgi:hypothetical protein